MKNRYLLVIAVMLLTSVLVKFFGYDPYHKADAGIKAISNIPLTIGEWKGRDVYLDARVYEILETKSIINRRYISNNQRVFLSIVYYPETKVSFHPPEACLGSHGIALTKSVKSLNLREGEKNINLKMNQLIYNKQGDEELVYYFYKAGEFLGQNYIRLKLNLAMNKFFNKNRSGSLIRVSTPIASKDHRHASAILVNFIQDLYPYLIKYL